MSGSAVARGRSVHRLVQRRARTGVLCGQSRECLEHKEREESRGPWGSLCLYAGKHEFSRLSVGPVNETRDTVLLLCSQCCGPTIHVSSPGLSFPHLCGDLIIPEVPFSLTDEDPEWISLELTCRCLKIINWQTLIGSLPSRSH